ncbi:hypothetical protein [Acinetobacter bereziniae]|uniref:hypothetical protein n=1 Tax=Acinetobacter bereziniae TaxID=106648 RepID=UPI00124E2020|nr:hypothetical protein [Acinetobacter bereziniae]
MENLKIKIGDSFTVPIQFFDTNTDQGFLIPTNAILESKIVNSSKQVIAEPMIKIDQDKTGFIVLEVSSSITRNWKVGTAQLDIKMSVDQQVRHSETIQFLIEASIT